MRMCKYVFSCAYIYYICMYICMYIHIILLLFHFIFNSFIITECKCTFKPNSGQNSWYSDQSWWSPVHGRASSNSIYNAVLHVSWSNTANAMISLAQLDVILLNIQLCHKISILDFSLLKIYNIRILISNYIMQKKSLLHFNCHNYYDPNDILE